MEAAIILLTIGAYGLAAYLWWVERTPNYLVALLAGHLGSLPSPLWQHLYNFSYNSRFQPVLLTLADNPLPQIIFIAAWTMMIPPLLVFWIYRHRWWFPGYLTGLVTYVLFVIYHFLVESIGARAGWWAYEQPVPLPLGISVTLLSALMNALVSLGLLSLLILTRRYAWLSLLLLLLPMPLLLNLFVNGLLGAPLYTVLLLGMSGQGWAGIIGLLGTLGLVLWAAHIVASSIEGQRNVVRNA
ncbi:MAG TPA: hypothetical protein VFS21_18215 [Roseiflexaceae bacterium]|nr:hypothetical protein [Roseiflexaceae bacterium]